jgi:hypothetical protein
VILRTKSHEFASKGGTVFRSWTTDASRALGRQHPESLESVSS